MGTMYTPETYRNVYRAGNTIGGHEHSEYEGAIRRGMKPGGWDAHIRGRKVVELPISFALEPVYRSDSTEHMFLRSMSPLNNF